jgi:hypothetical protein
MDTDTTGMYLSNDGVSPFWSAFNQLPPSTVSTENKILQSVGNLPTWVSLKNINNQSIIGTGDIVIQGFQAESWDIV